MNIDEVVEHFEDELEFEICHKKSTAAKKREKRSAEEMQSSKCQSRESPQE